MQLFYYISMQIYYISMQVLHFYYISSRYYISMHTGTYIPLKMIAPLHIWNHMYVYEYSSEAPPPVHHIDF